MKKFIVLMLAMITMSVSANADNYGVCKVAGDKDGATVSASILTYNDEGEVQVQFSSDCNDYVAIQFEITLHNPKGGSSVQRSFVYTVAPNSNSTPQTYKINHTWEGVSSADISVTGARCK